MTRSISDAVLAAQGAEDHSDAVLALGLVGPPTNEQIIKAAQTAYQLYQSAVDATTTALANIINTGQLFSAVQTLDALNWQSPGIKDSVVEPLYASTDVQTAITAAAAFPQLNSFSVGVFSKALPGGGGGMVGFDRDIRGSSPQTSGVMLTLDIFKFIVTLDPGKNLQFGNWIPQAGALHDNVVGLYISTSYQGVDINMKILRPPRWIPTRLLSVQGPR